MKQMSFAASEYVKKPKQTRKEKFLREQARKVVFEYIEVFYNRIRRHAKIGNQVPADFANQYYAAKQRPAA